jgi:hypothetical protein
MNLPDVPDMAEAGSVQQLLVRRNAAGAFKRIV